MNNKIIAIKFIFIPYLIVALITIMVQYQTTHDDNCIVAIFSVIFLILYFIKYLVKHVWTFVDER